MNHKEQLEDANKGLQEWREVALEALSTLRGVLVARDEDDRRKALVTAWNVIDKWSVD